MEFWNDVATDKSWDVLIELSKELNFILIGGWAAYLHTKTLKSKDIDIVVNFGTLDKLATKYRLKKNMNLKKYEIVIDQVSVDIYVPYFSDLVIPLEELDNFTTSIEGIRVIKPELLLILKQEAEMVRKDSIKGQKDRTDIINVLINSDIKLKKYFSLVKKYELFEYPKRLEKIIKTAKKEFEYLGIRNPRKIKLIKKRLIKKIKVGRTKLER